MFLAGATAQAETIPPTLAESFSQNADAQKLQLIGEQQADEVAQIPTQLAREGVVVSPEERKQLMDLSDSLRSESQAPGFKDKVEDALRHLEISPRTVGVDVLRGLGYAGTSVFSVAFAPIAFGDGFFQTLFTGRMAPGTIHSVADGIAGIVVWHYAFAGLATLGISYGTPAVLGGLAVVVTNVIVCAREGHQDEAFNNYCNRNSKILSLIVDDSKWSGEKLGIGIHTVFADIVHFFHHPKSPTPAPSDDPQTLIDPAPGTLNSLQARIGDLERPPADAESVREDLRRILQKAGLNSKLIQLGIVRTTSAGTNQALLVCNSTDGQDSVSIEITASSAEWAPTFYHALQKIGFLFPHPRMQISPSAAGIIAQCGKTFEWKPRFLYRGFHLHTQHPNEWMEGFLQGKTEIADDLIRWLARNGQNVFQVVLLRSIPVDQLATRFREPYDLARHFGILRGLDASFSMAQQKAYRFIVPFPFSFLSSKTQLINGIKTLEQKFDFDYLSTELGSTEVTSTSYKGALEQIEIARSELESNGKRLFVKDHVSSNQSNAQYGNFNFLPQYSAPSVGIQPHTVMIYGLEDQDTPVYGRQNFSDMAQFIAQQNDKRPTWYFPETSYWCGLDIDVPLFLTDFLVARSSDLDWIENHGVNGSINFTSGQELGYWLFDWTLALMNDSEHRGDPFAGLELLGEDRNTWKAITDFQTRFMKGRRLYSILSASNLVEELPAPLNQSVLARHTMDELHGDRSALSEELAVLNDAISAMPDVSSVKNVELRTLLETTNSRILHAHAVRMALSDSASRADWLTRAEEIRLDSASKIQHLIDSTQRYPETSIFDWQSDGNATSYNFGYLWTAKTLHYWAREEGMVRDNNYSAFYENIIDPTKFLF